MITRGELQPGDRLPAERDMAESLGVSRASVREALTALETVGILDIRPGEGTFVRRTSDSETFESLTLLLSVERTPEVQMMEVRRILETQSQQPWQQSAPPAKTCRKFKTACWS